MELCTAFWQIVCKDFLYYVLNFGWLCAYMCAMFYSGICPLVPGFFESLSDFIITIFYSAH